MKKRAITYCSTNIHEQRKNSIERLADDIVNDIQIHPDFLMKPIVRFEGTYLTYSVHFSIQFRLKRYDVVMYFGYAADGGEIYVERNKKIVSSADLPDDIVNLLWRAVSVKLPSKELTNIQTKGHPRDD